MEGFVVVWWASVEEDEDGSMVAESGCCSSGSLSARLPLRRVVACAEEVADRSGDVGLADAWRVGCVGVL